MLTLAPNTPILSHEVFGLAGLMPCMNAFVPARMEDGSICQMVAMPCNFAPIKNLFRELGDVLGSMPQRSIEIRQVEPKKFWLAERRRFAVSFQEMIEVTRLESKSNGLRVSSTNLKGAGDMLDVSITTAENCLSLGRATFMPADGSEVSPYSILSFNLDVERHGLLVGFPKTRATPAGKRSKGKKEPKPFDALLQLATNIYSGQGRSALARPRLFIKKISPASAEPQPLAPDEDGILRPLDGWEADPKKGVMIFSESVIEIEDGKAPLVNIHTIGPQMSVAYLFPLSPGNAPRDIPFISAMWLAFSNVLDARLNPKEEPRRSRAAAIPTGHSRRMNKKN